MNKRTWAGDGESERTAAAQAYDVLAPHYDERAAKNPILTHVAGVSADLVRRIMSRSRRVLDLGCGTGREAILLAQEGKEIVACDPSGESLAVLEEKAIKLGVKENLTCRRIKASELSVLEEEFGRGTFDGAYSSFALSYEPELAPISAVLGRLLKPRSPLLLSVFNRYCLSELLLLAPLLLPRRGLHRLLGRTLLPVGPYSVQIWSRTPGAVRRSFEDDFRFMGEWALPAILPPHYLHRLVELLGPLREPLERIDRRLNGTRILRALGSHTAFLFEAR